MTTKFIYCFLFFLLPFCLLAQPYSVNKIPAQLLLNANDVVREDYGEFTMKSPKEGFSYFKKVVTILNEDSDAVDLTFHYTKDTPISKISIKIYDAVGNLVQTVKKKQILDYSATDYSTTFGDSRVKHYKANYKMYPFTIAYSFKQKEKGMSFALSPHWFFQGANSTVEHTKFRVKLPKGQEFEYQLLNIDIETQKETDDDWDSYTWEASNLLAIKTEDNMPMSTEVFPILFTALGEFQVEEYTGGMSSWEEYSTFVNKLFRDKDELPDELKAEIKVLIADAKTDIEKVEILYRFMQKNMRYVSVQLGIGGWQPFDAAYVYRNKYGDCKALTNYMCAMLGEAGIKTYPALIYRGAPYYKVGEDFVAPKFNHVVLHIPSENYWLECTSTDYPPNYLGSSNENRNALLIQETGGHLIKTPVLGFEQNIEIAKTMVIFQPNGFASIKSTVKSTGKKHEKFRYFKYNFSEQEIKEWFLESTSIPSNILNNLEIKTDNTAPQSTFSYDVTSKRFGSKAGKRMFVPLNCINVYKNVPKKKEKRHYPITISENFIEIDTIIIKIPDGYQVESIPNENQQLERAYGKYTFQVKKEEGEVTVIRRLEIHNTVLPAKAYNDYRKFFKVIAKTDGMKMVLIKK